MRFHHRLFLILLLPSLAYAGDVPSLTFQEFKALTTEEQVAYIEDLRRLALAQEEIQQSERADASFTGRQNIWALLLGSRAIAVPGGMCIYAGYISTFDSRDKCTPPQQTKTWTLKAPNGASVQQSFCSGPGQTMCNPMLYGFGTWNGSSYSGFCSSSRTRPTSDCESQYQRLKGYKAADIATQLVANGNDTQFAQSLDKYAAYCAGEGRTRQSSLCKLVQRRTAFLKQKIAAEKAKADAEKERLAREQRERDERERLERERQAQNQAPTTPVVQTAATANGRENAAASLPAQPPMPPVRPQIPAQQAPPPAPVVQQQQAPAPAVAPVEKPEMKPEALAAQTPPPKPRPQRSPNCFHNKETWQDALDSGELPAMLQKAPLQLTYSGSVAPVGTLHGAMEVQVLEKSIFVKFRGHHNWAGDKSDEGPIQEVCVSKDKKSVTLKSKGKPPQILNMGTNTVNIQGVQFSHATPRSFSSQLSLVNGLINGTNPGNVAQRGRD